MLCYDTARRDVRVPVTDIVDQARHHERVPLCERDADIVEAAVREGKSVHVTLRGDLYVGEFDRLLAKRP